MEPVLIHNYNLLALRASTRRACTERGWVGRFIRRPQEAQRVRICLYEKPMLEGKKHAHEVAAECCVVLASTGRAHVPRSGPGRRSLGANDELICQEMLC
jgi:hypothetical protein